MKHKSVFRIMVVVMSAALFLAVASTVYAGFFTMTVTGFSGSCNALAFDGTYSSEGTDDDSGGRDYFGMVFYDGNGAAFAYFEYWVSTGGTVTNSSVSGIAITHVGSPAARPFTISIFNVSAPVTDLASAQNGTLESEQEIDPADSGLCTGLPLVTETTLAAEPVPGCDVSITIPSGAVGATIHTETPVYWDPGQMSDETFPAGLNVRAIGVDDSGMYTKVLYVCGYYWVPSSTIGPNYDEVWNGAPLPAGVVD